MKKLVLLAFFCASAVGQTSAPTIALADQKTLSDAYREWQQAQSAADTARLKFNSAMFESMANAKASPKEYEMTLNNGSFQLVKKEVKDAKAVSPNIAPAAKP